MRRSFVIDCLPESALRYRAGWAVVAVDVIRATTMAITAASTGRRCYPVDTLDRALSLALTLKNPLLAGELDGDMPDAFEINNTPAGLTKRTDIERPLVMLSSSGTRLIVNATGCDMLYLGCFRNAEALACKLADGKHSRIALLGAGSRGEFREEDQIGCAWVAADLMKSGYVAEDRRTSEIVERWRNSTAHDCLISRSVAYLKRTNQMEDLEFILERVNDLDETYLVEDNEVVAAPELDRTSYRIA